MKTWMYVVGGALLTIPLVASAREADAPVSLSRRQKKFRCAFAATGLGDEWLRFFEQTVRRESNFRSRASNTSSGERAAARNVAERVGYVEGIDFSSWGFGSRGLFQFLGPIVAVRAGQLRFPASMTTKKMAYRPGVSIAAALDYVDGLMGWNNFAGTWASLNVGWGNPSKMGNDSSLVESARKMENRAAKLGYARGWANDKVPNIRRLTKSEMQALANTADSYYQAC